MALTKIEWADYTFNCWIGCSKVPGHPGCSNCYAESFAKRTGKAVWGPKGTRTKTSPDYWKQPLKWNAAAELDHKVWSIINSDDCISTFSLTAVTKRDMTEVTKSLERLEERGLIEGNKGNLGGWIVKAPYTAPKVFCASLADVGEEWDGPIHHHSSKSAILMRSTGGYILGTEKDDPANRVTMDDVRHDLFTLIDQTDELTWLLLTKRPENFHRCRFWPGLTAAAAKGTEYELKAAYRDNVWLGCSISDQKTADKYVPQLCDFAALVPVLWLSAEPMIGPIVLRPEWLKIIKWVVIGGESGSKRGCDVVWIEDLVKQCRAAGIAAFVKQLGAVAYDSREPDRDGDPHPRGPAFDLSCRLSLNDKKGGDWEEWPNDLKVREFPEVVA